MKPHTATLSVTVLVNAPAQHVFARLTDWPAQSEWMVGTTVRATKQSGQGIGAELSAFTGVGPIGFTDTMIITVWDPPHQCSVRHTGHIVKGEGDFIVTPISAQQSTCTWSERFILPFGILGKLTWPAARPFVRLGLRVSLKQFARWAEHQTKTS
jgi:uncharacterized protein YndB with AHSA1/START domain